MPCHIYDASMTADVPAAVNVTPKSLGVSYSQTGAYLRHLSLDGTWLVVRECLGCVSVGAGTRLTTSRNVRLNVAKLVTLESTRSKWRELSPESGGHSW